jgi:hypothetical protein
MGALRSVWLFQKSISTVNSMSGGEQNESKFMAHVYKSKHASE